MRPTQRQRYAEQIDRLVRYLHTLDWSDSAADVDLEQLASIGTYRRGTSIVCFE